MESWVYGYPLVLMDVTRDVMTAAPAPNADGTAAPINQLAKMPTYVSPDFKNVVRISLNSLWTTGWMMQTRGDAAIDLADVEQLAGFDACLLTTRSTSRSHLRPGGANGCGDILQPPCDGDETQPAL